ncbi:hypothetical protein ABEB36_014845 [Hypothenemus hampei]|uniref:Uncharacterized protein n=1 Tax=Hypothenemus hampei TaxID=57062 RepID=A0ABD1E1C2_HYPHA
MRKFLTQKELELALEDIVQELQEDDQIDAVYIPPEVDELTDEEDFIEDVEKMKQIKMRIS